MTRREATHSPLAGRRRTELPPPLLAIIELPRDPERSFKARTLLPSPLDTPPSVGAADVTTSDGLPPLWTRIARENLSDFLKIAREPGPGLRSYPDAQQPQSSLPLHEKHWYQRCFSTQNNSLVDDNTAPLILIKNTWLRS
jgi:hypothetical protein